MGGLPGKVKFKLAKAILKCQLDIFNKIDSVLASIQDQLRQEAVEDGNEGEGQSFER